MRFPADHIHRILRGEISATLRRWHARPTGFKVGGRYAIERVDDVRQELDNGDVVYEREVTTLTEAIEIVERERTALDQLPVATVKAAGFEDLEELVDVFRADNGGPPYQFVWVFQFQVAYARPLFLARQNGLTSPPQYTSNPARAIDDLEVVDERTQTDLSKRARGRHARQQKKALEEELAACATPDERHQLLVARARDAGVDVRSELRSLERRLIQKIERRAA